MHFNNLKFIILFAALINNTGIASDCFDAFSYNEFGFPSPHRSQTSLLFSSKQPYRSNHRYAQQLEGFKAKLAEKVQSSEVPTESIDVQWFIGSNEATTPMRQEAISSLSEILRLKSYEKSVERLEANQNTGDQELIVLIEQKNSYKTSVIEDLVRTFDKESISHDVTIILYDAQTQNWQGFYFTP